MEHIFLLDINRLRDKSVYDAYFEQMSPERQKKITEHKMEEDRLRSLGAGIVLDAILKQYGLCQKEVTLEYVVNGKAVVRGRPEIHFNLSHSGNFAAGACGPCPVGIDIEKERRMNMKTARRFFCESEYSYLESQKDEAAQKNVFFRFWVLKESFMKVTGLGMRLALNEFEIRLKENAAEVIHSVDDRSYYFKEFTVEDSHMAVCSPDPGITDWEPVWLDLMV